MNLSVELGDMYLRKRMFSFGDYCHLQHDESEADTTLFSFQCSHQKKISTYTVVVNQVFCLYFSQMLFKLGLTMQKSII